MENSDKSNSRSKPRKQFFSNPNVSSLSTQDLISRNEVKKSRRPNSSNIPDQRKLGRDPDGYYSADNVHDVPESNQEAVIRSLDKLNMVPANKSVAISKTSTIIPKLTQSLASLLDSCTLPTEFNHVREDIIMQKITDIRASTGCLIGEEDVVSAPPLKKIIQESGEIQKMLSLTDKSRDKGNSGIKSEVNADSTEKKGLFGKFKKIFSKAEKTADADELKAVDHIHAAVDWSPVLCEADKYISKPYSWGTIQRLRSLRAIYDRMKDPEKGLKYNIDVKGSNGKYLKESFTADQLIAWLQLKIEQDFSEVILSDTLTDATTLARLLFHLGYIVSAERSQDFTPGDYIFQAPFFLPSEIGSPSNEHYARYLLRRSYNSVSKYKLLPWEITNFEMLENLLSHKWKSIEEKADKDLRFISRQAKIPSRIFKLQEQRFWRVQRSTPDTCEHFLDEESLLLKRQRLKWIDYENKFSTDLNFVLAWNEKKVNQLKDWQLLRLNKVSLVAANLIEYCNVVSLIDPFVDFTCSSNSPWVLEDESLWDPERPICVNEIKYWKSGLEYIMLHPKGLDLFWEFCKKEFSDENLKFITACIELNKSPTMHIFDQKAKYIYLEFIKQGASSEININSTIKKGLHNIFLPVLKQKEYLLPEHVNLFDKAYDHIFKLIEKDSYSRFCKSEIE